MKEQYIKQVKKELSLPRKAKKEVLCDLNEAFASALEHGETEQQVIQRFGTSREFANSMAAELGVDNTLSKKRKAALSAFVTWMIASFAFSGYAVAQLEKVPKGAIGQANAMTHIQLTSALDISQIIFVIGVAGAAMVVLSMLRIMRKNRR